MNNGTLYMGWSDLGAPDVWFPVGRLDADLRKPWFRFRHLRGAAKARETRGFYAVFGFGDDLSRDYQSPDLFPVFQNRVMSRRRPDFADYVEGLGLDPSVEPEQVLWVDGGRRVTDSFEVFPKLTRGDDGSFSCRFFPRGLSDAAQPARERMKSLDAGESLRLGVEAANGANRPTVLLRTGDGTTIGRVPRYFAHDLAQAVAESNGDCQASVVRVNPPPFYSTKRVLVEVQGRWDKHEPMSGEEFQPLSD